MLVVVTVAVVAAVALASESAIRGFLDYYAGVVTLVTLTGAVVWGLVSTDVAVLDPRRRLLAQGVHRATGVVALAFLVLHVGVKVAERHVTLSQSLVPYGVRGRALLIGLGTLAGYLLLLAVASGALRSAFAVRGHPLRWRMLHACAYASWFGAVVHGLKTGRSAAGWVVASYVVCLLAVAGAGAVRLASPLARRGRRGAGPGSRRVAPGLRPQSAGPAPSPLPQGPAPGGFGQNGVDSAERGRIEGSRLEDHRIDGRRIEGRR